MNNYGNLTPLKKVYGIENNASINFQLLTVKNNQFLTEIYFANIIENCRH